MSSHHSRIKTFRFPPDSSEWPRPSKASGAGAGAQKAIGTGVFGEVVTSTLLVTIFAPIFYVLIEKMFGMHVKRVRNSNSPSSEN